MLICPNCKSEFEDGVSICSDCGTALVKQPEEEKDDISDKWNWLKDFGNITAKRALTILFYLGLAPLFISSILFRSFLGIVYFIFGVLIWKIICELLIIVFRCFETYVEKNKRE
ncbi:hypothetical protein JK636_23075 [Clostridium sp. YIM B02515]|uniref:Zinc ribbon domain-containing protein n=1 Tax=Clostridium rhizosphaerae TaxID=2803861 RepID=A0ABS1TH73_9CLOT|nr:hypothetical protein [Clostridium rhizosphaerae]MBL4938591.1 hypothetical protein [Clostridium rhizosphaerae]